ncbi:MAG: Holliday junction resolvase RuvX, partial [Planctomycetia bacterium]|nr:Holliday junction resolvase RuvX [Planctomycetia bacterium]
MTEGVVVGIDYGTVRIGVAISDEARRLAVPLATYR